MIHKYILFSLFFSSLEFCSKGKTDPMITIRIKKNKRQFYAESRNVTINQKLLYLIIYYRIKFWIKSWKVIYCSEQKVNNY